MGQEQGAFIVGKIITVTVAGPFEPMIFDKHLEI